MARKKRFVIGEGDALVLIDMQNDFREGGALYVAGVKGEINPIKLVPNAKKLLKEKFGVVVATRDWHPKDHREFAIYGMHCVANTPGAQIISELESEIKSHPGFLYIFNKGEDGRVIGYSVVYGDSYKQLIQDLEAKGIKRIFIVGLAYTHCVGESAIDFIRQHIFEVLVIRDATLSVPPPFGDPKLMDKKLEDFKVKVINMDDIDWS